MNHILKHRAFTLIELLIVIAIIGILASVVIGTLNGTRARGTNAVIMQNMHDARTQGELYYSDNAESYSGICGPTPTYSGVKTIHQNLLDAQAAWGTTTQPLNTSLSVAGSFDRVTCHENGAAYAAEVPLKESATGYPVMWCLDSLGNTKQQTTNLGANVVVCD